MTQHRRRGVAVGGRERDADAGGDQHLLARDLKRAAQGLDQPIHEGHDVAEIGDVDEGNGEFVAGQPRDEVVLAQGRLDAAADVAQHLIAAAMVGRFVDLLELVDVETEHGDMRAVALHAADRVGEAIDESLAIGEAGEGVVLLEVADLLLGFSPLASAHPGERGGHGDAGAKQGKRDADHPIEIIGEHGGLIALVEIDDERAARFAVHRERQRERCKIGRRSAVLALIERDRRRFAGGFRQQSGELVVELQPGEPAGEIEVAVLIVKLVAEHAVAVAPLVEDVGELRRGGRAGECVEQSVGLVQHLHSEALRRGERLALELVAADLAGRNKGRGRDQGAEHHQSRPVPMFLERRQTRHDGRSSARAMR